MKYSIVLSSITGNTKMLAEKIKEVMGEDCLYFGKASDEALEADLIFVGSWTDRGHFEPSIVKFIEKLKDKKVFVFGTAGFSSPEYFEKISSNAISLLDKSNEVVGSFVCQGKMPQRVKDKYLKFKEEGKEIPNLDLLIENFDLALSHPDNDDLANLVDELKKIK